MKMARSGRKKHKRFKEREEELPSFLKHITEPPEEFGTPPKTKSKHYLGPIFFGDPCTNLQPPLHVLSLGAVRKGQGYTPGIFKQSIDELFYDFEEEEIPPEEKKETPRTLKRKKPFYDPYPNKYPGTRKVFPLGVKTPAVGFGTTTSIIEGETSMEFPLCRIKSTPLCRLEEEPEVEFIMPSDLREERWKYLSRIEQISHAHFPKRFVTVTVNGPNIPASLTITRLQCKRTREYDAIFLKKPEEEEGKEEKGKIQKKKGEKQETNEETEAEESQTEEDTKTESEADEQSLKSDAFSAGTRSQQSDVEKKEETVDEEGSSKMAEDVENDEEGEIENEKTVEGEAQEEERTEEVEAQEEERTEEVEAQGDENPDKQEEEGD